MKQNKKDARQESGAPGNADLGIGSSTPLWHREYWDRYIRNEKHFLDTLRYIEMNPVKAGLCKKSTDWKWSSADE